MVRYDVTLDHRLQLATVAKFLMSRRSERILDFELGTGWGGGTRGCQCEERAGQFRPESRAQRYKGPLGNALSNGAAPLIE